MLTIVLIHLIFMKGLFPVSPFMTSMVLNSTLIS